MTDIATVYDPVTMTFDWQLDGPSLLADDGLETATIISLFSDARADDDEALPDDAVGPFGNGRKSGSYRRGWFGDFVASPAALDVADGADFPPPSDRTGSKWWLLVRKKTTPDVLQLAAGSAEDALAWMIEDKVAAAVSVTATRVGSDVLDASVEIDLAAGPGPVFRYATPAVTVSGGAS